ncbi:hypothetical protein CCHR01_01550 [Colletotrichum chrysophilum]|uniref:Uncharacterized protein n=1 Tax=Colletotrichum chrysophilum TaxID=1836956 RepID=A0AAD9AYE8_9PEZI|nr:hypothetical protein CCHR01_01550 [Colletotrichum chrysophilum]
MPEPTRQRNLSASKQSYLRSKQLHLQSRCNSPPSSPPSPASPSAPAPQLSMFAAKTSAASAPVVTTTFASPSASTSAASKPAGRLRSSASLDAPRMTMAATPTASTSVMRGPPELELAAMIMPASADALNRLRHAVTLQHSSTAAGRTQHKWHQLPKLLVIKHSFHSFTRLLARIQKKMYAQYY